MAYSENDVPPKQAVSKTVYLEGKSTTICFINGVDSRHNSNHAIVLQRVREFGLKILPDKCEFLKPELEYLGHIVTAESVKPNPKKLEAVNFTKQFTLTTDYSNESIGAILSQDGHPCCYISRNLNPPQRNYSTTEKELLAIVWAVKRFRQYLFLEIPYSNRPSSAKMATKLQRPLTTPDEMTTKIRGIRIGIGDDSFTETEKNAIKGILLFLNVTAKELSLAWKPIQTYSDEEVDELLRENHDLVGDPGIQKTYDRIRERHRVPDLMKRTQQHVESCDTCQTSKTTRIRPREESCITDTPLEPNDKIAMDLLGPLKKTKNGNQSTLLFAGIVSAQINITPLEGNSVFVEYIRKGYLYCDNANIIEGLDTSDMYEQ
ncbi:uncharacterized protein LOC105681691, partial [Bombus impatiens]|uniref:RNA-directed DNA polymerase n=1 Tax=Bombus impatiens TaxID=132113 RepID=A0A6P3V5M4_BOMIM